MAESKRLYRSNDALIAGVCGGIAKYFSVSPALVRTIATVLLVIGMGAPALIYLAMVLVVPREPSAYADYVDVDPLEKSGSFAQNAPKPPESRDDVPPISPETTGVTEPLVPPCPRPTDAGGAGTATDTGDASRSDQRWRPGAAYSATYSTVHDSLVSFVGGYPSHSLPFILIATVVIFIGAGVLMSYLLPSVSWWALWPIIIILFGCVVAFRRTEAGRLSLQHVLEGVTVIVVGFYLLACTTRLVGWNIWMALVALWPLFLIVAGIIVLGKSTKRASVISIATLALIGVLVLGAYNYYNNCEYLAVGEDDMFGLEQPTCPDNSGAQQYFDGTEQQRG